MIFAGRLSLLKKFGGKRSSKQKIAAMFEMNIAAI
jgi:hypothetical protein